MSKEIRLRFAGLFVDGLEFVEAKNSYGKSIEVERWERDGDSTIDEDSV